MRDAHRKIESIYLVYEDDREGMMGQWRYVVITNVLRKGSTNLGRIAWT